MRVLCRHGHFAFYPRSAGDLNRFAQTFGKTLIMEEDYFTFEELAGAPDYSILGVPFLNLPATKTFEGKPWEVMRENGFVYNLKLGLIVPKITIVGTAEFIQKGFMFIANTPILQPGVRTVLGQQILSYSGEFYEENFFLRVTEYAYV